MYLVIWEYQVAEAQRPAFEQAYGPEGEWARLFTPAQGYLGTELCRDEHALRYLSIDRWASAAAYQRFRQERSVEYHALDLRFEGLAERETFLGGFVREEQK